MTTTATQKPFVKAFACAAVSTAVILAIMLMGLGRPADLAHKIGQVVGYASAAALIAGYLARRSANAWSLFRIAAVYLLILVAGVVGHTVA
jgi:hypothetical protein